MHGIQGGGEGGAALKRVHTASIATLGCKLNQSESDRMARQLAEADARERRLVARGCLETSEGGETGLERWSEALQAREGAVRQTQAQIEGVGAALEALDRGIQAASEAHAAARGRAQALEARWQDANAERKALEADVTLRSMLELECIDADSLDVGAIDTLDRAARDEQRVVIKTRLTSVQDEQALDHLSERGLLPPSTDTRRALDLLRARLGGQAWSGWE